jgi:hypothetical protein
MWSMSEIVSEEFCGFQKSISWRKIRSGFGLGEAVEESAVEESAVEESAVKLSSAVNICSKVNDEQIRGFMFGSSQEDNYCLYSG